MSEDPIKRLAWLRGLEHPKQNVCICSPRPNRASASGNKKAAEAALRALGVVFRVEGE
jgi:hypothetical protein